MDHAEQRSGRTTVNAVFSGLQPVVFTATATADAPTTIEMVSGNGQSAAAGADLTNPLVVRVTDANDNPVPNVPVAWSAEGGGSVSADNTPTDAQGLAQVTRTLGLAPGPVHDDGLGGRARGLAGDASCPPRPSACRRSSRF